MLNHDQNLFLMDFFTVSACLASLTRTSSSFAYYTFKSESGFNFFSTKLDKDFFRYLFFCAEMLQPFSPTANGH